MNRERDFISFILFLPAKETVGRLFHRCYYNLHRVVFFVWAFFFLSMGMGLFFTGVSQTRALVLCSF